MKCILNLAKGTYKTHNKMKNSMISPQNIENNSKHKNSGEREKLKNSVWCACGNPLGSGNVAFAGAEQQTKANHNWIFESDFHVCETETEDECVMVVVCTKHWTYVAQNGTAKKKGERKKIFVSSLACY